MGIFDTIRNKANNLTHKDGKNAGDLPDQVKNQMGDRVQQLGDKANDATGNRFSDQIDQGVDTAKQRLGNTDDPPQQQQP